jgi:8-oxo-dGTP pyrophosphatase MutT (NUDIX family)
MMNKSIGMSIRENLRKRLLEGNHKKAVGVCIMAEDTKKVLLLLRGWAPHKGHWSILSGGMEDGEDKLETLKREIMEEIGIDADTKLSLKFKNTEKSADGTEFHYYESFTPTEFIPKLDAENKDYGWYSLDDLPSPLYPKTKDKIEKICQKNSEK